MRITTTRGFTTANKMNKRLLNVLAKSSLSTYHQSTVVVQPGKPTAISSGVGITVLDHSPSTRDYNDMALQSDIDDLNWHKIVTTPHVQRGLRRLAAEARRQAAAGEIEEGGFVVE